MSFRKVALGLALALLAVSPVVASADEAAPSAPVLLEQADGSLILQVDAATSSLEGLPEELPVLIGELPGAIQSIEPARELKACSYCYKYNNYCSACSGGKVRSCDRYLCEPCGRTYSVCGSCGFAC
jgi:hypothetical protein